MSSTINFTQDIPRLGNSIVVKTEAVDIATDLREAQEEGMATIQVKSLSGKEIQIPVNLVGPVEQR